MRLARIAARVGAFLISDQGANWRAGRAPGRLRVPAYIYVPGGIW